MASCGFMSSYDSDYFVAWHSCFREYCQHWGCQAVSRESGLCAKLSLPLVRFLLYQKCFQTVLYSFMRKDFKEEDLLVGLANSTHLINFPTSNKKQRTAASLSFSKGTVQFSARKAIRAWPQTLERFVWNKMTSFGSNQIIHYWNVCTVGLVCFSFIGQVSYF